MHRVSLTHSILILLFAAVASGCLSRPAETEVDMEAFQQLARSADCDERSNRLFVIDGRLVFWDRQGDCPDNSYRQALYDRNVEQLLCERYDSIAGALERCIDAAQLKLFDRILQNLNRPDLGLGDDHDVREIRY